MKKITVLVLVLLVSFSLSVAAGLDLTESDEQAVTDWEKSVVQAEGTGWADQKGERGRSLAKIAAKAHAQAELVKKIKKVNVSSETKVSNQKFESQVITTTASGTLKGARVIKEEAVGENGYRVVMEVRFYGKDGIIKAIHPQLEDRAKENQLAEEGSDFGVEDNAKSSEQQVSDYTGIIVNAADLDIDSAVTPKIYAANGELVYAISMINYEGVQEEGLLEYRPSLADAKAVAKIGSNPLVVNAQQVRGDYKTDIVVSNRDAQMMNQVGYENDIFATRKVVVVKSN